MTSTHIFYSILFSYHVKALLVDPMHGPVLLWAMLGMRQPKEMTWPCREKHGSRASVESLVLLLSFCIALSPFPSLPLSLSLSLCILRFSVVLPAPLSQSALGEFGGGGFI